MWTQDQYESASKRAEELRAQGRVREARDVLEEALEEARGAGHQGFIALMEGEIASLDQDYEQALELLARAFQEIGPHSRHALRRANYMMTLAVTQRRAKLDAWRTLSARSAHRIGNQLFAARGALRALTEAQDPRLAEAAADLEGCLDRIQRIVQEFRAFSRSEEPRLLPTDVGPLVSDIVRRYAKLAEEVDVTAEVPGRLPRCSVDRAQFDQAVGELLENALRHTSSGGRIRVTAEAVDGPTGRKVRIVVADTGPGIPGGRRRPLRDRAAGPAR